MSTISSFFEPVNMDLTEEDKRDTEASVMGRIFRWDYTGGSRRVFVRESDVTVKDSEENIRIQLEEATLLELKGSQPWNAG